MAEIVEIMGAAQVQSLPLAGHSEQVLVGGSAC
jgi:hypothetical protein